MPKQKASLILYMIGIILFIGSIFWVNLHASQWFNFDMFADASVAQKIFQQKTLFPRDWLFGNQYYIIATPAVAALFYSFTNDPVLALTLASSLYTILVAVGFVWCCRPVFSGKAILAGLFCLVGACILGDSSSSCTYGFQVLYTMAGYYACYFFVAILHIGILIRLQKDMRAGLIIVVLALLTSMALGIQSPREMLVVCIPAFFLSGLLFFVSKGQSGYKRAFLFSGASLVINLAGILLNPVLTSLLHVKKQVNISSGLVVEPTVLIFNLKQALSSFSELLGFRYLDYNWKWRPIALLGFFFLGCSLIALFICLLKTKDSADSFPLWFCWFSLFCTLAAGIVAIKLRAIYFFLWYLLVPFSISFLTDCLPDKAMQSILCLLLLLAGTMNYAFNFLPDYMKYSGQQSFYHEIVNWMEEKGYSTIYGDYQAPTIAAVSGHFSYYSVFPESTGSQEAENSLLKAQAWSPVSLDGYQNTDPSSSVLILSDSPYDENSGYRWLEQHTSEAYRIRFEEAFTLEASFPSLP